jgi:hypothetical protein
MMMTTTIRETTMMILVEDYDYDDENDDYDDNDGCNTDDKMLMIKKIKIVTILYVQRFWRSGGTDDV